MTSPTFDQGKNSDRSSFSWRSHLKLSFLPRRGIAWAVEVSFIAISALVPYSIGRYANAQVNHDLVPLHPVLANTQDAIAKTLALPKGFPQASQVPPLTNLFWWIALVSPVAVSSWQVYLLAKTGQTLPKRWFQLRVINRAGDAPGFAAVVMREGIGRWGIPAGTAYLIWRYTGAFPHLGILCGLTGVMLLIEAVPFLGDRRRRPFHDRIAGTFVIDATQTLITYSNNAQTISFRSGTSPLTLQLQSVPFPRGVKNQETFQEKVTQLTLSPQKQPFDLWQWIQENRGITVFIVTAVGLGSILITFVGTQMYIQNQTHYRELKQQKNEVFLALVKQLSTTSPNSLEERRAAILTFAQLDDERVIPLLVDLLGQEQNPDLIETLQQTLVTTGPNALPALQRLNQSLRNDINQGSLEEQKLRALRLRASKRAIAKLLSLYSGKIHNIDLNRIDLGKVSSPPAAFALNLDSIDLSGINLRGAILSHASFQGSHFYNAGKDKRWGTFDDWMSDLSGADLKEVDFTGAFLKNVTMNRTNLIRAILNGANLTNAQMVQANLSSSQIINADLRESNLQNASFTGANLGESDFSQSNLNGANLGQVKASGGNFAFTSLVQSNWQGANLALSNFTQANLKQADLSETNLIGANLAHAQLQQANLRNADLSRANLRRANLDGADFDGVKFATLQTQSPEQFLAAPPVESSITQMEGVDFSKVKNLSIEQLNLICQQGGHHPQCE